MGASKGYKGVKEIKYPSENMILEFSSKSHSGQIILEEKTGTFKFEPDIFSTVNAELAEAYGLVGNVVLLNADNILTGSTEFRGQALQPSRLKIDETGIKFTEGSIDGELNMFATSVGSDLIFTTLGESRIIYDSTNLIAGDNISIVESLSGEHLISADTTVNLSNTARANSVKLFSSTGDSTVIQRATVNRSGVMTKDDKAKLNHAVVEAPADSVTYGRKDEGWSKVVDATGDTMTGAITFEGSPHMFSNDSLGTTNKEVMSAAASGIYIGNADRPQINLWSNSLKLYTDSGSYNIWHEGNLDITSKEDNLGVPQSDGYVLSSTTSGTRSWVRLASRVGLNTDATLQDNATTISNAVNKINALLPLQYEWTQKALNNDSARSATDVNFGIDPLSAWNALPESVYFDHNGEKRVKYSALVTLLVAAIKEQRTQISDLESRIVALENA